jgi:hypothetical protein
MLRLLSVYCVLYLSCYIVTYCHHVLVLSSRLHVVVRPTASMSTCNLLPPCRLVTYCLHVVYFVTYGLNVEL